MDDKWLKWAEEVTDKLSDLYERVNQLSSGGPGESNTQAAQDGMSYQVDCVKCRKTLKEWPVGGYYCDCGTEIIISRITTQSKEEEV